MELGAALSGDLRTDHTEARVGGRCSKRGVIPTGGEQPSGLREVAEISGPLGPGTWILFHVQWDTLVGSKQRRLWIVLSALVMRFEWRGLEAEAVCLGMIEGEVEGKS